MPKESGFLSSDLFLPVCFLAFSLFLHLTVPSMSGEENNYGQARGYDQGYSQRGGPPSKYRIAGWKAVYLRYKYTSNK